MQGSQVVRTRLCALSPVALQAKPKLVGWGRLAQPLGHPGLGLGFDLGLHLGEESGAIARAGARGVGAQPLPQALELPVDVVDAAEVSEAESLRAPLGDRPQGALPRLQVDVRRWRGRDCDSCGGIRTPATSPTNASPVASWRYATWWLA